MKQLMFTAVWLSLTSCVQGTVSASQLTGQCAWVDGSVVDTSEYDYETFFRNCSMPNGWLPLRPRDVSSTLLFRLGGGPQALDNSTFVRLLDESDFYFLGNGTTVECYGQEERLAPAFWLEGVRRVTLDGIDFVKCRSNGSLPSALLIFQSSDVIVKNCNFRYHLGPAILVLDSQVVFQSCDVSRNNRSGPLKFGLWHFSESSAGVMAAGYESKADISFEKCTFFFNINLQVAHTANGQPLQDTEGRGAAVQLLFVTHGISIRFHRCWFRENIALQYGGGIYALINANNCTFNVTECDFEGNAATIGGAISIFLNKTAAHNTIGVTHCRFFNNMAHMAGAVGIVYRNIVSFPLKLTGLEKSIFRYENQMKILVSPQNDIIFDSCVFARNSATGAGSAVVLISLEMLFAQPNPVSITNCTFTDHFSSTNITETVFNMHGYTEMKRFLLSIQDYSSIEKKRYRLIPWKGRQSVLYSLEVPIKLSDTTFSDNNCLGIYLARSAAFIYNQVTFMRNQNTDWSKVMRMQQHGEGSGGAIQLAEFSQIYVQDGCKLNFSHNQAEIGAGIFNDLPMSAMSPFRNSHNPLNHGCFIIFDAQTRNYTQSVNDSEAMLIFEGNVAVKGAAIYTSSLSLCSSWWKTNCTRNFPTKNFYFRNNFSKGHSYSSQTNMEAIRQRQNMNSGSNLLCEIATDGTFLALNVSKGQAAPGEMLSFKAEVVDNYGNPSMESVQLLVMGDMTDKVSFSNMHFGLGGTSNDGSTKLLVQNATETTHTVHVNMEPMLYRFSRRDPFKIAITNCRAGYELKASAEKNSRGIRMKTCTCLEKHDDVLGCDTDGTAVVIQDFLWGTNSSPTGGLTTHNCPFGFCRVFCTEQKASKVTGMCCNKMQGFRGCAVDSYNLDAQCTSNRQGTLCGGCADGHSVPHELFSMDGCVKCHNQAEWLLPLWAVLICVITLGMIYFDVHLPGPFWSFVHFVQIVSFLPLEFEDWMRKPLAYLAAYFGLDFVYGQCVFHELTILEESTLPFLPFFIYSPIVLVGLLLTKRHRWRHHRAGVKTTFWSLLQLTYCPMLLAFCKIVECTSIKYATHTDLVLWYDGNIPCWKGDHLTMAVPAIIFFCLVLFPAPLLLLRLNYRSVHQKGKDPNMRDSWYGSKQQIGAMWWPTWDMYRRLIMVTLMFIIDWGSRQSVRLVVIFVELLVTLCARPWQGKQRTQQNSLWMNVSHATIDSFYLLLMVLVQLVWMFFLGTVEEATTPSVDIPASLEAFSFVMFGVWFVWYIYPVIQYRRRRRRRRNNNRFSIRKMIRRYRANNRSSSLTLSSTFEHIGEDYDEAVNDIITYGRPSLSDENEYPTEK